MVDPKKFDPARAHVLDAPEREAFLPTHRLVTALDLRGDEQVVDYGSGTGTVAIPAAARLHGGGMLFAVDESEQMLEHLRDRASRVATITPMLVAANEVPLDAGSVDRVLAVNLLHEVRGEGALKEMRRLLSPDGWALVVDWERGRTRPTGPPDELLYSAAEAAEALDDAGFVAESLALDLPFHFAFQARPI